MTNALEIKNLKKSFGNLEVIKDVSLIAKQGDQERVPYYDALIF